MKSELKPTEKLLVTQQEAADLLSVCVKSLTKLPIPRYRVAGAIRYKLQDIRDYVSEIDQRFAA